jgi:hypothetical protein
MTSGSTAGAGCPCSFCNYKVRGLQAAPTWRARAPLKLKGGQHTNGQIVYRPSERPRPRMDRPHYKLVAA